MQLMVELQIGLIFSTSKKLILWLLLISRVLEASSLLAENVIVETCNTKMIK
jgi:hypothetical protein